MNKKGFVLAEAIIVAVFVLGMFTYLAMNIFPLITKYDQANNYDNPNEVYLANVLYDELVAANKYDSLDDGIYNFSKDGANVKVTDKDGVEIGNLIFNETYFKNMTYKQLKVTSIVIVSDGVPFEKDKLSRGMRQYYNYMQKHNELTGRKSMLLEFENGKFAVVSRMIPVAPDPPQCFTYTGSSELTITGWDTTKVGCSIIPSNLVIPKEIKVGGSNKPVKKIGTSAFYQKTEIKTVRFLGGIEEIGKRAFYRCNISGELSLPDTLKSIGEEAFSENKISGALILPDKLTQVSKKAFYDNDIVKLEINNNLTLIGDYAFQFNSILGELNLNNVKSIGHCAFFKNKIQGTLNLSKVESLGTSSFEANRIKKLVFVDGTLESAIEKIPDRAFFENDIEELLISSNVKKIASQSFQLNLKLKKLQFAAGSKLESIGSHAFRSTIIEEINFPFGLKSIEYCAFYFVSTLKNVTIPSTIEQIGYSAFDHMKSSSTIIVKKASEGITLGNHWNGLANVVYNPS